jgi:phospholipid/cholesterol/gamma-HCH transport system ATP-binding protein
MAYGDFLIQQNLTFEVKRGEVFIIMGPSGCGKSTVLKSLVGLKSPAEGAVMFSGEDFWGAPESEQEQWKRRFGMLFQSGA